MQLYKRRRDGKGGNWYIELQDHTGARRRFAAFSDKGASRTLGSQLEKLVAYRNAGRTLDDDLSCWLETLPPKMIKRLVALGVIDRDINEAARPLMIASLIKRKYSSKETLNVTGGHLADFRTHMQAKDLAERHTWEMVNYCAVFFDKRELIYPSEIVSFEIESYLKDARDKGKSARTVNAILIAIKAFCNWMVAEKRMKENPGRLLSRLNTKADRRIIRRALTKKEISALLEATPKSGEQHGLTGHERTLVYRLALSTGLRWNEIYTLDTFDFNLEGKLPCVTIRAENEKAGRGDTLPLDKKLAADIAKYFASKEGAEEEQVFLLGNPDKKKAFKGMWQYRGAEMLRKDLDAAGIDWRENERGEKLDFHSLRHTFGTMLAQKGVHPKTAQDLMRHSTIDLTMEYYTHTVLSDRAKATEGLIDLTDEDTDDSACAAS